MKTLQCTVTDTKKDRSQLIEVCSTNLARDLKLAAHATNKLEGYKRYTVTVNF